MTRHYQYAPRPKVFRIARWYVYILVLVAVVGFSAGLMNDQQTLVQGSLYAN